MKKYKIDESSIDGLGVIATETINASELIELGIDFIIWNLPHPYKVTEYFGKYVNHSDDANGVLVKSKDEKFYFYAKRDISIGEEITLNYNDELAPKIIKKFLPNE